MPRAELEMIPQTASRARGSVARRPALAALGFIVLATQALAQPPAPLRPEAAAGDREERAAPVVFWNRRIVVLRGSIGRAGPQERARVAQERLRSIEDDVTPDEVTIRRGLVDATEVALVTVDEKLVFSLVPDDLDPLARESLGEAAEQAGDRLRQTLRLRAEQRRWPVILRGLGESAVASLLFALLIWLLTRLPSLLLPKMERGSLSRKARLFELDLSAQAATVLRIGLLSISRALAAAALYVWATFVLSRFPYTQPWADALGGWLLATLASFGGAVIGAVPGLATVALILLLARGAARLLGSILSGIESGRLTVQWLPAEMAKGVRRIAVLLIWLFAIAIAYPFIPGSSIGAFQGVSVLVGLMVTIGSAGLINHVLAGWVILFARGMSVGDWVTIGEHRGRVLQLGVLSVKLETDRGEELHLPNAVVTGNVVVNLSQRARAPGSALVVVRLSIGYDAPWRQVHGLLEGAAAATSGVRRENPVLVRQAALSDFFVEYELVVEVESERRASIESALRANVQDAFNEAGVQIMSPHFVRQPENPVVVPPDRWNAPTGKSSPPDTE